MFQIDLLKSKSYLLVLAKSLTCYKHDNFHVPKPYTLSSKEQRAYEIKGQERMLQKKVKQVVGWDKFNEVFMVSAYFNQGSSDIQVIFNIFKLKERSFKAYILLTPSR